jgi:hypothetical protein
MTALLGLLMRNEAFRPGNGDRGYQFGCQSAANRAAIATADAGGGGGRAPDGAGHPADGYRRAEF